jgi:hypothetical protein
VATLECPGTPAPNLSVEFAVIASSESKSDPASDTIVIVTLPYERDRNFVKS